VAGTTGSYNMRYFRRSLRYLRPYVRLAVASSVVLVAAALIGLLAPWPLKVVIDHVLGRERWGARSERHRGEHAVGHVVREALRVRGGHEAAPQEPEPDGHGAPRRARGAASRL